jgi:hypothetical protein
LLEGVRVQITAAAMDSFLDWRRRKLHPRGKREAVPPPDHLLIDFIVLLPPLTKSSNQLFYRFLRQTQLRDIFHVFPI